MSKYTLSIEADASGVSTETEKELTFYGEITSPEGLKQAYGKETQVQAQIKQGEGRSIRVRHTQTESGDTYEMTAKVQTGDDMSRTMEEKNIEISKDIFELFLASCRDYQKKTRYFFKVESVTLKDGNKELKMTDPGLKYEVDVFEVDGKQSTWCKVDVEVQDLDEHFKQANMTPPKAKYTVKLSSLPIGLKDPFVMNKDTPQDLRDKLTRIYDEQFLTRNFGKPDSVQTDAAHPGPNAGPDEEAAPETSQPADANADRAVDDTDGDVMEGEEPAVPADKPVEAKAPEPEEEAQ